MAGKHSYTEKASIKISGGDIQAYADGTKTYIIAPNTLKVGDVLYSGPDADIKVGNTLPLANIPVGTIVHCVELKAGKRNDELCEKTRELLRTYPGVYCVESFDPNIVTWFKKNAPDIVRGQLAMPEECYAAGVNRLLRRLLAGCRFSFLNRPDFIAYRIGPRPARVLRKREKGVLLIAWTSRDYAKDAKENDGVIFEACTPPLKYDQL